MSMGVDFLDVFYGDRQLTNFGAMLFQLIAKADERNIQRIRIGFPRQVSLYEWWMSLPEPATPEEIGAKAKELEILP